MDVPDLQVKSKEHQTEGIGIDLGLKEFAVLSMVKSIKISTKQAESKSLKNS